MLVNSPSWRETRFLFSREDLRDPFWEMELSGGCREAQVLMIVDKRSILSHTLETAGWIQAAGLW